jgi:hypothetical protein
MSDNRNLLQTEIDNNLAYFLRELPAIPALQKGKVALLRHQAITGYYDTVPDAINAGRQLYPDGIFSIQQVTNEPVNLGFYSYAVSLATAQ